MEQKLPKIVALLIAAIILTLLSGCSQEPAVTEYNSDKDLAEARIGVLTGSTGEQLANKHFPEADIKSFDDMNFSALIPALQSGKIDLIVTGMSATDERRQSVDFSEPYFANRQVFMLKKASAVEGLAMETLDDVKDKRVGVYSGTVYDKYVQDNFPEAEILRYNNPDIGILTEDALDPTMVSQVLSVIRRLAREGMTMAIVTHEMEFARSVSTRVFYMDEGLIYEDGPAEQIFSAPLKEKTRTFINRMRS